MSHESREQPIPLVEKVSSIAELLPALKRGAKAAVWEGGPLRVDVPLFKRFIDQFGTQDFQRNFFGISGCKTSNMPGIERKLKNKRSSIEALAKYHFSKTEVMTLLNQFDILSSELVATLKLFPKHTIRSEYLGINKYNSLDEPHNPWHQDLYDPVPYFGRKDIRLIRAVVGPTTEYAFDQNGTGAVRFKDASLAAHRCGLAGAWHRYPVTMPVVPRMTYAIWLAPSFF